MASSEKTPATSSSFETQRDALVQEVASAMDSVVRNLETLNRTLNDSVEVGKDFENVGRLWNTFYNNIQTQKDLGVHEESNSAGEQSGENP